MTDNKPTLRVDDMAFWGNGQVGFGVVVEEGSKLTRPAWYEQGFPASQLWNETHPEGLFPSREAAEDALRHYANDLELTPATW